MEKLASRTESVAVAVKKNTQTFCGKRQILEGGWGLKVPDYETAVVVRDGCAKHPHGYAGKARGGAEIELEE
jgi:hypothetical protein